MKKNTGTAIVFDPHPDDADWWTGGLTLLLQEQGWDLHYVCVGACTAKVRKDALASARILGVTRHFLELPLAGNLALREALRQQVPKLIAELAPQMVFIPPLTDYHQEHVMLAKELFGLFHWSAGLGLGTLEVYAYDSHENRNPIEIYIDVSTVWERHLESLRCHRKFARSTLPENTLIRVKTGRAMILGASLPATPVLYAEGYHLLQGRVKEISSLPRILRENFYYRNPQGLLAM